MKRTLALVALMIASPAVAQVRVVAELAMPSAPAVAPTAAVTPSFSMPVLGPSLSAPSLAASPMVAAPAPVTVQAALIQTGAKLSAASKDGQTPDAVSRATFDAASTSAEAPAAVAAAPSYAQRVALDEPNSPKGRVTSRIMGPVKTAVIETAEVAVMSLPFAIVAFIMKANMTNPAILIPSMLGLWALGFFAMRAHLAGTRSTVVGGWQASHDQKYRVDYNTGLQKDIRGKKYGEDRYDEREDGAVGPRALAALGTAAAVAAAAFLLL